MSKKQRTDWFADGEDGAPPSPAQPAAAPMPVAARSILADVKARAQGAATRDATVNDNAKRVAELTDSFEAYLRMHEMSGSTSLNAPVAAPPIDVTAVPTSTPYEPAALPLSGLFGLSRSSFNNSLSISDLLSGRIEAALAHSILLQQQQQQQPQPMSLSSMPPPAAAGVQHQSHAFTTSVHLPPAEVAARPVIQMPTLSFAEPPVVSPLPAPPPPPRALADLAAAAELGRLVIAQQPGPKSFWKKRVATPAFAVRIVTPPGVALKECGPVRAYLISDAPDRIELENWSVRVDSGSAATFDNLRFSKGSHQHLAHLYFECQVVATDGRIATLTSPQSDPFIVCTNISQWLASEKKILKHVAFPDEAQVEWQPTLRQHLEGHFARAVSSCRGLMPEDMAYIHEHHLGGAARVTLEAFDSFWEWYGPAVKEVYEKAGHARLLWERYWLIGFMSRETAVELLAPHEIGTFLIAFSHATPSPTAIFARLAEGITAIDPEGPLREAMIAHKELTTLLCVGADRVQRQLAKITVVRGLRRRKDSESPPLL